MKNVKTILVMLMVLVLIVSVATAEFTPSASYVPVTPLQGVTADGTEIPIIEDAPHIYLTTVDGELLKGNENSKVVVDYNKLVEAGSVAKLCEDLGIVSDQIDFNECNTVFVAHFEACPAALELGTDTPVTLYLENTYGLEGDNEVHAIRLGDDNVNEVVTVEVTDEEIQIPATIGGLGTYILLDR